MACLVVWFIHYKERNKYMQKIDYDLYLDDDNLNVFATKRIERKKRRLTEREKRVRFQAELVEHAGKVPVDVQQHFNPSFQPGGHERVWLLNYLESFYNAQIITDILGKVKGGKEANVYCCLAHASTGYDLIAAKVYRPRMFRNLRNDSRYRQGRPILDENGKQVFNRHEVAAVQKNTRFGQEIRHMGWLGNEFQTMQLLHDAGADVPRPLMQGDNVILMEYVGGYDAPGEMLNHVILERAEARRIFERLVEDLSIMLACHRVHADFSAYNVLYYAGQFKIIDFPQAVDPRLNLDAQALFQRDVERLCQYFARYRIDCDAATLATDLWSRYQQATALDTRPEIEYWSS